jgi:hypothetical protein
MSRAGSAGIHTLILDDSDSGWSFQKSNEGLSRVRLLCIRGDAGGEDQFLLQLTWKGTSQFDARRGQHADDKDPEFRIAFGDGLDDLRWRRLRLGFGFHRLADAKAIEYAQDVSTGRACREKRDGFCFEQRFLQASEVPTSGLAAPARTATP